MLEEELGDDLSFEEYERKLLQIMNELSRQHLEKKLQGMSDSYPDKLRIDHNNDWHGIREGTAFDYRAHETGSVTYHSLVGGLKVRRFTYRECCRNGSTYVPLELDAGLIERMTPGLGRCIMLGFADMPMRPPRATPFGSGTRAAVAFYDGAMDYVGTVSVVDAQAQRLVCRKSRLPSDVDPALLVQRMMLDLRHALDRVHLKLICCDLSSKPLAVLLVLEIALLFLRVPALRPTPNPASRKLSLR